MNLFLKITFAAGVALLVALAGFSAFCIIVGILLRAHLIGH